VAGKQFSGIGGHEDFVSGPGLSDNGRSLVCLPSTTMVNGTMVSRIMGRLPLGTVVTTPRHQVDVILIASKGGAPENPLWFENLVAEPEVWIQIGARSEWATASIVSHETDSERRDALWRIMCAIWPSYDEYQTKADVVSRVIPVVTVSRSAD